LQLRVVFETGDKAYYWLNNVVAVGRLSSVEGPPGDDGESFWLRIDVWHVSLLLFVVFLLVLGGGGLVCCGMAMIMGVG